MTASRHRRLARTGDPKTDHLPGRDLRPDQHGKANHKIADTGTAAIAYPAVPGCRV
jgi:hypothetical protein